MISTMKIRRRIFSALAIVMIAFGLSGCDSLMSNLSGPPANLYTLTPKNTFAKGLPKVIWQLVVEEPMAAGGA